jgi:hypothetical protein
MEPFPKMLPKRKALLDPMLKKDPPIFFPIDDSNHTFTNRARASMWVLIIPTLTNSHDVKCSSQLVT